MLRALLLHRSNWVRFAGATRRALATYSLTITWRATV